VSLALALTSGTHKSLALTMKFMSLAVVMKAKSLGLNSETCPH